MNEKVIKGGLVVLFGCLLYTLGRIDQMKDDEEQMDKNRRKMEQCNDYANRCSSIMALDQAMISVLVDAVDKQNENKDQRSQETLS